jgi:DNA-binding transcriptional ArsR family regulator
MSDTRKQADASRAPVRRALSHVGRLELFTFLVDRGNGKTTDEQELSQAFGMSIRLVEYHLLILEGADLIANIADELGVGPESCYVATARL